MHNIFVKLNFPSSLQMKPRILSDMDLVLGGGRGSKGVERYFQGQTKYSRVGGIMVSCS